VAGHGFAWQGFAVKKHNDGHGHCPQPLRPVQHFAIETFEKRLGLSRRQRKRFGRFQGDGPRRDIVPVGRLPVVVTGNPDPVALPGRIRVSFMAASSADPQGRIS
jgi:hypothetical protein